MLKTGMIIAERYEIAGKIGAGGMADVYKAKDHKLNRYVAVKVLKAEFRQDATFVKKFRSEAQAAAGLTHPNIVSVFDVGDDEGVYYIVMELIEGITLKEYILKKDKLTVKEATSIAIQVCMGLEAAHNHGIVHRDVKPQNIIISNDGKVKVTDFGIARAASSNTISSNVMGSVHYSSPEQVRGGYSDEKSDIYSLGITLYEMVTGRVPFDGDTTVAIAIKHLQEEMVAPSTYAPDLPYSLEQIIYKCTQKSVNRRYDRMEEVIADLKRSLIDPSGDFVVLAPSSNGSATKRMSEAELHNIRAVNKQAKRAEAGVAPEELQERQRKPSGQSTKARSSTSTRRSSAPQKSSKGSGKAKRKSSKKQYNSGIALPLIAMIAGFSLLVAVIIIVGHSAGLIGTEDNSGSTPLRTTASVTPVPDDGKVTVPSLVGYNEETARTLANDSRLGIQLMGEEPSNYEKGIISRQDPVAGSEVEENTTIKYYISLGTSVLTIPYVDGSTGIEAQSMLEQAGLVVKVSKIYSELDEDGYPVVDPGYAYYTDPASGESANVGDTVTLYVSRGVDYGGSAELPNVVGMQKAEALTTLGKFMNIEVREQMSDEVADGEVISQNPTAYSYVDPDNDTVVITVSTGNRDTTGVASAQAALSSDPSVIAATDAGEVWKCTQRLNTPGGYHGGLIRLELEQQVGGQSINTMVVDGERITFPYQLDLTGIPGISVGYVHLYEQVNGTYTQLGTYTLEFSEVSE